MDQLGQTIIYLKIGQKMKGLVTTYQILDKDMMNLHTNLLYLLLMKNFMVLLRHLMKDQTGPTAIQFGQTQSTQCFPKIMISS